MRIIGEFYVLFCSEFQPQWLVFKTNNNMHPYIISKILVLYRKGKTRFFKQLLYVCYAYLLITKLLKILIFAHGEHKNKLIRMYSILFYIRIHS
jgi:hypothetical protein